MNQPRTRATPAEAALHARLLAGDHAAPAEVAEIYLAPLMARLLRVRRDVADSQIVEQAAIDAVFDYVQRPQQYDPARRSLDGYLFMAASGDLANALKAERRHTLRAVSLDADPPPAVELALAQRNGSVEEQVLERLGGALPDGLDRATALRLIAEELPDARDRQILLLMHGGERRTAAFARLLDIADRPKAEQETIVKRNKDRIQARLRRLRAKWSRRPREAG